MKSLGTLIRDVPDFPKKGIIFKDITPLLADAKALAAAVKEMVEPFRGRGIDMVCGVESRGFIFGAAAAIELGAGFVPIRKPGKLPWQTVSAEYTLEYGADKVEVHCDAIRPGQKALMIDDLLATGGTMAACCDLVKKLGGEVAGVSFAIELSFLHGRDKLAGYDVRSLIQYGGE